jgi:hypothetical protein
MYIPKPGDLIFAPWMGIEEHNSEVMEFLGSTSRGIWTAANYLDRSITYNFALSPIYGDYLKRFNKFGIHRLSKKLKPKFHVDDIVEITIGSASPLWLHTKDPIVCQITQIKLKYAYRDKKCYIGYNFKLLNETKHSIGTVASLKSYLNYIREHQMRKFINYNKIWDIFHEND